MNDIQMADHIEQADRMCPPEEPPAQWIEQMQNEYAQEIRAMYAGGMTVEEIAEAEAMPVSDVEYMTQ